MTREEAALILTRLEEGCDEYAGITNYAKEALQMAITALEADNVVERIAYMSQLNGGANYFDAFMALSRSIKRNGEKSEALQADGGCISKQAAIGEVAKWMLEYGGEDEKRERVALGHVANGIKKLPSVQPERCEDCKNFSKTRLLIPQPERKKGKWKMVLTQDLLGFNTVCFQCSECNGVEYSTSPFCRMCGANMEEGENDG